MEIRDDILNRLQNIDSLITDADNLMENYIISYKERYLIELLASTSIPRKFF